MPRTHIEIEAKNLFWTFHRSQNHMWIAHCQALGQAVQADRFEDLSGMIHEVTSALLVDLFEEGQLEAFLAKRGWTPSIQISKLPAKAKAARLDFEVPYQLMAAKNAQARSGAQKAR